MPDLHIDPPAARTSTGAFLQTLRLVEGKTTIAQARWVAGMEPFEGVAQIIEIWVDPTRARQGHAKRLMEALTEQARKHFRSRKSQLRRLWIAVDQKRNITARGFLMKFTFHHVGTVKELLRDEDLLIYMRTFD